MWMFLSHFDTDLLENVPLNPAVIDGERTRNNEKLVAGSGPHLSPFLIYSSPEGAAPIMEICAVVTPCKHKVTLGGGGGGDAAHVCPVL